ncbi:MAG: hypothetical protein ABIQ30_06725 [Devosia sp.]
MSSPASGCHKDDAARGNSSLGEPMSKSSHLLTPRMVADFCRKRLSVLLPPQEVERLQRYLLDLLDASVLPPTGRSGPDWREIAAITNIDYNLLRSPGASIGPCLDAIGRAVSQSFNRTSRSRKLRQRVALEPNPIAATAASAPLSNQSSSNASSIRHRAAPTTAELTPPVRQKRKTGYPARQIIEFPEPLWLEWTDPKTFPAALALHMTRHDDTAWHLHRAIVHEGDDFDRKTIVTWRDGSRAPRSAQSLEILGRIERRYRLPAGYFKAKFTHKARATTSARARDISPAEQRRLAWHLPDDFEYRPIAEQEEILAWVRSTIISGTTDYRRFQAAAMRQRYAAASGTSTLLVNPGAPFGSPLWTASTGRAKRTPN